MNDKSVTAEEVEAFLLKLKASDNDKKVDQIQLFGFELENAVSIPESILDAVTQSITPLLRSTSQLLVTSTLTHLLALYLPLLPTAPHRHIQLVLVQVLPVLLEKLNDPKERIHSAAAACIAILGRRCYEAEAATSTAALSGSAKGKEKEGLVGLWERCVKEVMIGKGSRGKIEAVKMLSTMRAETGSKLPLKPWLQPLVDLLEDGDGTVREQAREALASLLSPPLTPVAAKSELKKLLLARGVRKSIADPLLARIFAGASGAVPSGAISAQEDDPQGVAVDPAAGSGSGVTPSTDDIPVVYIASARDLEGEFAKMLFHFEGKETEHNWGPREKSVVRVRGMLRGDAHRAYREAFVAGLRSGLMEGFQRTIMSLRTTVAQQSCAVVQELPEHLGSSFDPFVEGLLPVLGKMAGLTKKIIAEKSQKAVVAVMRHTTCHPRVYIAHISSGVSDKNVQSRHFSASHLRVFLDAHGYRSKSVIDTTPGLLDMLDSAIRKGLGDVNPSVRELAREAFWSFNGIWPARGKAIVESLDGAARKQLEKANGQSSSGAALTEPAARPAIAKRSTTMSAMIAEKKRLAKAAEAAASSTETVGSPRVVSNPMPASPAIPQGPSQRAVSSTYISPLKGKMTRSITSPVTSPVSAASRSPLSSSRIGGKVSKQVSSTDAAANARSRSSSLARTMSKSPPPRNGSPAIDSSLQQAGQMDMSSTRSSSAATMDSLRTPTFKRKPIPSYTENGVGLGIRNDAAQSPSRETGTGMNDTMQLVVDDALRAQADQALSAAEQLLDFDEPKAARGDGAPGSSSTSERIALPPVTPARPTLLPQRNGSQDLLRTPVNGGRGKNIWEDSPRNQAVTPLFLEKLKGRRYERSWWSRQQQLLEKASPLKSGIERSSASVQADVAALATGRPGVRNLQRLFLFCSAHPVSSRDEDEDDHFDSKKIWEEDRLFERIFEGLMVVLNVSQPRDLLEQALVLLWEMVQHQWALFEDRESSLVDALFRLRASDNHIILESTYSLLSLLTSATDHLILLGIIQSSLDTFLLHNGGPARHSASETNAETVDLSALPSAAGASTEQIKTSGYIFALNGIGMCILRLPAPVVLVEASRLEPLIMTALESPVITVRQAANTLILAIQCVLADSTTTLSLLPRLSATQRNLATYLMETNGLMRGNHKSGLDGDQAEEERMERVIGEMDGLMSRSMM